MPQAIPQLQVQCLNGREVFPSIICEECDRYPTQHRCLFEVSVDGYLFEGRQVCGIAVCSICSSSFGNEGFFTCAEHVNRKENLPPAATNNIDTHAKSSIGQWTTRHNKAFDAPVVRADRKMDEEKKKKERGVEYSATEILLLSKAWIAASENTITGVHQKLNTFWDSVLQSYNVFKKQHEEYMEREKERDKFRMRNLNNSVNRAVFMESDSDEDNDEVFLLPVQNVGSLQQKWSKKVQLLIFKFIGVTKRYPKKSGEDKEAYYNRVHIIFLKENVSEKSFDIYRPSWEYLQDKPKFSGACALPSGKKKEVITIDENEEVQEGESAIKLRPMGRNSMKRKMEEEKILASVSKQMESEGAAITSSQLAGALQEIAKCIGSALANWQMQLAVPNASAHIQRQYYDTIVKQQIQQMMTQDTTSGSSNSIPNQIDVSSSDLQTNSSGSINVSKTTTAKGNININNTNDGDDDDDDDLSEVPGTIPPPKFIN